jgi:hypothetical protein
MFPGVSADFNGIETDPGADSISDWSCLMSTAVDLEVLVQNVLQALPDPTGEAAHADTTMRERFFELMVLIFGNLYSKTPVAAALFDRGTMLKVTTGMDDVEAGKLTGKSEDWLRIEGLIRQQDGAKAYFIPRSSLAVLSTVTSSGTLGDVMDKILRRYQASMPSENLRTAARILASYFLSRVSRS